MAIQRDDTLGVVVQSPMTLAAILTPMETPVATAMADAIVEAGVALRGITADAATLLNHCLMPEPVGVPVILAA